MSWPYPITESALHLILMTNLAAAPIGRSVATSSCARLGDISGDEGSWKMTPALVWRQWPVSINAEAVGYQLIPPDLAFYGSPKRCGRLRATIITTVRSTEAGREETLDTSQVRLAHFRRNTCAKYDRSVFYVSGSALSYLGRSIVLCVIYINFRGF